MNEWWRGAVLYQVWPRSFCDANGDGIGDLPGVLSRLDYIADLGVDGIWLSPFYTSPMADYGYDVADYRDVDPTFGSLTDFEALLTEAHARGLKVIIDQVYSHTSDQHAWFKESRKSREGPRSDWYVWADPKPDGTPPNNWLSVFGGPAWTWDASRRQYYLHNFLSAQPDLNFHNPDVREAILEVARFWLDLGVDGFRLDVANYYFHDRELRDNPAVGTTGHVRPAQYQVHLYERSRPENVAFIGQLRDILDGYADRMSVAEIDSTSPTSRSIEYTAGEDRLHTAYSFEFLRAARLTPALIRDTVTMWEGTDAWPSWAFSNHDVRRAPTRWGGPEPSEGLKKQLVALLGSLRGTAFLYQGDELGLPQATLRYEDLRDPEAIRFWPEDLGRDGARTPIPWEDTDGRGGFTEGTPWMPLDGRHLDFSVRGQEAKDASVLNFTRAFLRTRRDHEVFRSGGIAFQKVDDPLLVFTREGGSERLWCAFNFSSEAVALDLPAQLRVLSDALPGHPGHREGVLEPHGFVLGWLE